jgi:hypothetical protein
VKTITALTAKRLSHFLAKDFRQMFGHAYDETADRLGSLARSTIECLGRSDALYHNMEHTLLVTLVGRDILQGLSLSHQIEPDDYTHLVCACLLHDIGYVRGILSGDTESEFVINQEQVKIRLPRGASDAALAPYHVDRSKIFALERLGPSPLVDAVRVAKAIEFTRFSASADQAIGVVELEPKLVQAADLIGQLGDPMYPKKANALFYEFEETGMNRQLGYSSPADLIDKYPGFFWNCVSLHIEDGLKLLNLTASGRQWIANLHHHVLCAERSDRMMGPQLAEFTPNLSLVVNAPQASRSVRGHGWRRQKKAESLRTRLDRSGDAPEVSTNGTSRPRAPFYNSRGASWSRHRATGYVETIARDAPIKSDYIVDRTTKHAWLGETLQRLYAPAVSHPPDRFGQLLTLLDQRLGEA